MCGVVNVTHVERRGGAIKTEAVGKDSAFDASICVCVYMSGLTRNSLVETTGCARNKNSRVIAMCYE